ncbi:hypothetical protein [Fusobacterium sp. PH5-44]|uniref:hypothetical protein n=1 Tax=unclassified Fusobacterium TaxID=2648384 RepID=UPI003D1C8743
MKKLIIIATSLLFMTTAIFASDWRRVKIKDAKFYETAGYKAPTNTSLNGKSGIMPKEEYEKFGLTKKTDYLAIYNIYKFNYLGNFKDTRNHAYATAAVIYFNEFFELSEFILIKGRFSGLYVNDKTKEIVYLIFIEYTDDINGTNVGKWYWKTNREPGEIPDNMENPYTVFGKFSYKIYNECIIDGIMDIKLLEKKLAEIK